MRIVDLSMTVEECDSAPFAPEEKYFKLKPIIRWEEKGFVSNIVEMTVHAGTHIDSPHHFFRDKPSIEQLPLEPMMAKAIVLDLTSKGKAHARITPEDLIEAETKLKQQGIEIPEGAMLLLRTDWPKGHDTTDPKWWNDSPCLTKEAAEWVVAKKPSVVGYRLRPRREGLGLSKSRRDSRERNARASDHFAESHLSDRKPNQSRPDRFHGSGPCIAGQVEDRVCAGARDRDPRQLIRADMKAVRVHEARRAGSAPL